MSTANATVTTDSSTLTSNTGQSSQPTNTESSADTMLTTKSHSFLTEVTSMKTSQFKVRKIY